MRGRFLLYGVDLDEEHLVLVDGLGDRFHNSHSFLFTTFEEKPSRTFRDVFAHNDESSDADPPQQEHRPPMRLLAEESKDGGLGASEVPGPVDANVDSPPVAGRHKLVDSCEDSCKFSSHTT